MARFGSGTVADRGEPVEAEQWHGKYVLKGEVGVERVQDHTDHFSYEPYLADIFHTIQYADFVFHL